jgi:thioredoxin-dependent peroxiredoxin
VLGISPQDLDSHEKWAAKRELPFVLLADVDKRVISEYGVKGPALIPVRRSVFVIDPDGVVRFANRKLVGASFVPADTLVPVLETL